ncbi:MAG: phenylacetate-CoA ligase [Oceanicoccus sp.]|jgi:phenylacetate-CoA ligase
MNLWNPQAENMSRDDLRQLQLLKLRTLLHKVEAQSPYYQKKFSDAGVTSESLKSLAHYQDFPFFDKDEERKSQELSKQELGHPFGMHISCDRKKVNRISSSSGTTGSPTFSGFTKLDREIAAENCSRGMVRIGMEPGDVVLHASVLSMWVAGVPSVDSMMAFGACVVPVGALSGVERIAQIARETSPKMIRTTVSFARHLAKTMEERSGIDPKSLGIEKVVVTGEPGGSIPEIYSEIEAGFGGAICYDSMGATGGHSPIGISCEAHAGIHVYAEDNLYYELIDPKTMQSLPIEDGVEGEIIFTGLERECGPLLRWRDKDIIKVHTRPCSCGRPGVRMEFKGRVDDMLLVKGVNVFPNAIRDVVNRHSNETTGNIRVVLSTAGPVALSPVAVIVEHISGLSFDRLPMLGQELETAIHHHLRFRSRIVFESEGIFELKTGSTGKSKLVEVDPTFIS